MTPQVEEGVREGWVVGPGQTKSVWGANQVDPEDRAAGDKNREGLPSCSGWCMEALLRKGGIEAQWKETGQDGT